MQTNGIEIQTRYDQHDHTNQSADHTPSDQNISNTANQSINHLSPNGDTQSTNRPINGFSPRSKPRPTNLIANVRHFDILGPYSPQSAHLPRTIFASQSINQPSDQPTSPTNNNQPINKPDDQSNNQTTNGHVVSFDRLIDDDTNTSHSIKQRELLKSNGSIRQHEHHINDSLGSLMQQLFVEDLMSIFRPAPLRRKFARQLSLAFKVTTAFVICSIVAIHSMKNQSAILSLPYLSVLFVMLVAKQSVGDMMTNIDAMLKGTLMAVLIDCCLIAVGVPSINDRIMRIVTVELIMYVTSFILAFQFRAPPARRYSLAIHGMSCIAMATNPDVAVYYPFQLLFSLIIAFGISIIIAGLPFPRLARDELLDRYRLTAAALSRTFSLLLKASLSVEPVLPDILRARALSELQTCSQMLAHMRRLENECATESEIWRILFPWSISLNSSVVPDIDRFELLSWDLRSFHHALKRLNYQSEYHAAYAKHLRPGLQKVDQAQRAFFSLICDEQSIPITQQSFDLCKQRLATATQLATRNFLAARDYTYGYDARSDISEADSPTTRSSSLSSRLSLKRVRSRHSLHVVHEAVDYRRKRSDSDADECKLSSTLTHSTNEYFLRSTIFFAVLRFQSIMQNVELGVSPASQTDSGHFGSLRAQAVRNILHDIWRKPSECSFLGLHPVSDFWSMVNELINVLSHPVVDWAWLRSSLKVALIICVSSIVSVVPSIVDSGMLPNSLWSLWTAAVVISETEGGLFQRSMFRLMGTFIGAAVGYVILLAFPCSIIGLDIGTSHQLAHCTSWTGSVALLALWVFIMALVQESRFSYMGTMGAFSATVIVFGVVVNNPARLSAAEYSAARQVEIYLGVIVALVISCAIYPISSIHLLRSEFASSCDQILQAVNETIIFYQSVVRSPQYSNLFTQPVDPPLSCPDCDAPIVDETALLTSISAHSKVISKSLSYQSSLIGSAMYEPTALLRPFSANKHSEVSQLIRVVWMSMTMVESAVRAICKADRDLIASTDKAAHVELLQLTEYNGVLQSLIEQVSSLLRNCIFFLQTADSSDANEQSFVHLSLSERVDVTANQVMHSSHFIQSRFALSLNTIAGNVRAGLCQPPPVDLMIPIGVFLSSCIQCSQLAVRLVQAVGTLQHKAKDPAYED